MWFDTGSTHTSVIAISVSRLALFYLVYVGTQDSVLGPILFSLYTTPLIKIIQNYPGIRFHFYEDGMQLYIHLT